MVSPVVSSQPVSQTSPASATARASHCRAGVQELQASQQVSDCQGSQTLGNNIQLEKRKGNIWEIPYFGTLWHGVTSKPIKGPKKDQKTTSLDGSPNFLGLGVKGEISPGDCRQHTPSYQYYCILFDDFHKYLRIYIIKL